MTVEVVVCAGCETVEEGNGFCGCDGHLLNLCRARFLLIAGVEEEEGVGRLGGRGEDDDNGCECCSVCVFVCWGSGGELCLFIDV